MTETNTTDAARPDPAPTTAAPASRGGWLATAGFSLSVGSFVLWAVFGLPAPLVAVLALALGYLAVRRAGAQGRKAHLARWALRLGTAHLIGWAAFLVLLAAFGVFAITTLGV